MSLIPDKIEYRDCSPERVEAIVALIEQKGIAVRVSYAAATDKVHFDRYGYDCNGKKLGVVYDRKARMLSVSAPDDSTDEIKRLYASTAIVDKSGKQSSGAAKAQPAATDKGGKQASGAAKTQSEAAEKPTKKKEDKKSERISKKSADGKAKNALTTEKTDVEKVGAKAGSQAADKQKPEAKKQSSEKSAAREQKATEIKKQVGEKKAAPVSDKQKSQSVDELGGGNLSFKKFTEGRFTDVLTKLRRRKQFKVGTPAVQDKGKPSETLTVAVSSGNQRLKLRFMPKKQVLQVQGKQESLFAEVRLVVSEESDFKSAVTAHAENADIKSAQFGRKLKKLMPTAVKYMSEQVKLDFTIGIIELLDSTAEHYDYSILLLPPFRGLERLIFDIQRAQNVVVKMIGQAYEKENGEYVLKASYRRKINGVVYPEVLGALYREYFATRNFYAHSDAIGGENRVIATRKQAVDVFTRLCEVVEYNCRKLEEIRFEINVND